MVTLRRVYLYSVLAVLLVPVLVGLADTLEVFLDGLAEAFDGGSVVRADEAREDLSLALALLMVGAPFWGLHAWLLRRSTAGDARAIDEERGSPVRSTYFLVVLVVTLVVASWAFISRMDMAIHERYWDGPFEPSAALAYGVTFAAVWALHAWWRARDLRLSPERTAEDWLTRAYLYGPLFVAAVLVLTEGSELIAALVGWLVEGRSEAWLRGEASGAFSAALVLGMVWTTHWVTGLRLEAAPDPVGEAHRRSRARAVYFFGVVLVSVAMVLVLVDDSLGQVLLDVAGLRRQAEDPDRLRVIGGPLLASLPFLAAWWWHQRRVISEALAVGGDALRASATRIGRLVVAVVGVAGLAVGLATGMAALLDLVATDATGDVSASSSQRDVVAAAAVSIVGLACWLPAWVLVQHERVRGGAAVAASMARRAYLVLVSGVALVAAMLSGAWLAYKAFRVFLEAGPADETSLATGMLFVSTAGLAYHLWVLRGDVALAPAVSAAEVVTAPTQAGDAALAPGVAHAVESIEISGPEGADFASLNAALRARLPDGFELRVIGKRHA